LGLSDFVKKQFLKIIQWEDTSPDTMVYKFPVGDNEIMNHSQLLVRPGQCAIFLEKGQIADVFTEPNTYALTTSNLPILSDLRGWGYGFQSPFKADIYFVSTKQFIDQKWGTPTPFLVPDPKFEQVELKAFGNFTFRIEDPKRFVLQVTSTNKEYTVSSLHEQLKAFVITNFAPILVAQNVTVSQLAANYKVIDNAMDRAVAEEFKDLGLEMVSFQIESITMQEEYQEMLRKRTGVNIMGGMQAYAQVETLDAMKKSVENPGINALNQAGVGLGMGLGIGGVFAQNFSKAFSSQDSPPEAQPPSQGVQAPATVSCPKCAAVLPAGSQFCNKCGVAIPHPAADAPGDFNFCSQCGNKMDAGSHFCSKCGGKLA
jgi:membrane protease subunit (stomatin/prohibitin family)